MGEIGRVFGREIIWPDNATPLKFNIAPEKIGSWKTIRSYWEDNLSGVNSLLNFGGGSVIGSIKLKSFQQNLMDKAGTSTLEHHLNARWLQHLKHPNVKDKPITDPWDERYIYLLIYRKKINQMLANIPVTWIRHQGFLYLLNHQGFLYLAIFRVDFII